MFGTVFYALAASGTGPNSLNVPCSFTCDIRPVRSAPLLAVRSFKAVFGHPTQPPAGGAAPAPAAAAGDPLRLEFAADKPAELSTQQLKSVSLYVIGDSFWGSVASVLGSGVTNIAKSMLPLSIRVGVVLVPIAQSPEVLVAGSAQCQFALDFSSLKAKSSTVLKKLRLLAAYQNEFCLQVQFKPASGGSEQVLFAVVVSAAELVKSAETGTFVPVYEHATTVVTANAAAASDSKAATDSKDDGRVEIATVAPVELNTTAAQASPAMQPAAVSLAEIVINPHSSAAPSAAAAAAPQPQAAPNAGSPIKPKFKLNQKIADMFGSAKTAAHWQDSFWSV